MASVTRLVRAPSHATVIELAWFAAGAFLTLAADKVRRRRAITTDLAPASAPVALTPGPVALDARRLAKTLADELANLVSGVEGRAQNLIHSAPDRRQLPAAAESLLAAIHRLRTLHTKVVAFSQGRASTSGSTDVTGVISSLGDDLEQMQLGLELRWDPPSGMPPVLVAPDVVRDALLFVCSALLRAERGATHLAIDVELCFAGESPCVQVELALEWITEASTPPIDLFIEPAFTLDLEAADNLITSHGGELALSHLPGRTVRAIVRWPAATSTATPAAAADHLAAPTPQAHRYGGALLLEADPAIRAMLASELKATGRAVFACADIAAARSFLEATPDRFEVLIVDHPQRLDADEALLPTIRTRVPDLKICVLGQGETSSGRDWPPLHRIQKPFGVDELRRALASVLAG
jgi:hypothetical protein